ncbi:MAG: DUF5107 domain-containing protein [Anaerolineae bacterium]
MYSPGLGRANSRVAGRWKACRPLRARLCLSFLAALLALASCAGPADLAVSPATTQAPASAGGALQVTTDPTGATCLLDGVRAGTTPLGIPLTIGSHVVRLEMEGFEADETEIEVVAGQQVRIARALRDVAAPAVDLDDTRNRVYPEDGLKVVASAQDNVAVARMSLSLGDEVLLAVEESSLRYNVDTRSLSAGVHHLIVAAWDTAGNVTRVEQPFEVVADGAQATPTPRPLATAQPGVTQPSATRVLTATATPPATVTVSAQAAGKRVEVTWGEISIDTYAYEDARYTDPEGAGQPYPLLHRDSVGSPRAKTYQVLRMRNEYLELTLLPSLGGRIYQCRFLPTDQDLFYNNSVIKPTHWGPADQEWWLSAGGMEWCLPVDEHGYVSAEAWQPQVVSNPDGSATVTMRIEEQSRRIIARVDITLKPGEGGFHLRTTLSNMDAEPKSFQYWMNAMLAPGSHSVTSGLRFYYPASEVLVHSRGDSSLPDAHAAMPWPVYNGRDMASYANWNNYLGFFAPDLAEPYTAVYDDGTELGMVRIFPEDVAQGAKLFGFGEGFDSADYTDDGSQYVEMWGGLTPTFWDYATLEPNATISWEETWYVLARSGGPSRANAEASLHVSRSAEQLDVVVASPAAHDWTLRVMQGDTVLLNEAISVRPDANYLAHLPLGSGTSGRTLRITLTDATGRSVLSYDA